jgi:hypothetical protein
MIRKYAAMTLLTTVLLTVATAFAQSSDRLPVTDAEKIADALRAGPEFITKDATLLDWPSAPGGEYRLLRKGSNEWTCLPAIPGDSHDEPGCFDQVFLQFVKDCPALHPNFSASESHTCTVASGYPSRMRRDPAMNSTLGRTS